MNANLNSIHFYVNGCCSVAADTAVQNDTQRYHDDAFYKPYSHFSLSVLIYVIIFCSIFHLSSMGIFAILKIPYTRLSSIFFWSKYLCGEKYFSILWCILLLSFLFFNWYWLWKTLLKRHIENAKQIYTQRHRRRHKHSHKHKHKQKQPNIKPNNNNKWIINKMNKIKKT